MLKIIPHSFSNDFLSFPGSYFCSNEDDESKNNRTEDWKAYGVLQCSFLQPANDIHYRDPLSLQFKKIKQVLNEKKMIYSGSHFYAIRQNSDEINEANLQSCVRDLANQIYSYISKTTVPQLPCLSDADVSNDSQQESSEILKRESIITKMRSVTQQLLFEKDAEIRRVTEELLKYRNVEAGRSSK